MENESKALSFDEYLDKFGTLTYTFRGFSMMPMLRQKKNDLVIIKKKVGRLKKHDVGLYHNALMGDRYILHRIVKVNGDSYDFLGDNCIAYERGIKEDDVIGVLVAFKRGEKQISVDNKLYKLYVAVWTRIYPIRITYKKMRAFAARVYHKLFRRGK